MVIQNKQKKHCLIPVVVEVIERRDNGMETWVAVKYVECLLEEPVNLKGCAATND